MQDHHHFGEADGAEGVGDGELSSFSSTLRAAAQTGGVEDLQVALGVAALPEVIDADGIAGDAGFRGR